MKKKKRYEKYVTSLVQRLAPLMLVADWQIRVSFSDTEDAGKEAENALNCRYLTSDITLFPPSYRMFKEGKFRDLCAVAVHELVHILLEPVDRIARSAQCDQTEPFLRDENERAVERLTRVIVSQLPESFYS